MDLEQLERQKRELNRIQDDLSSKLAEFEARKGKDLSEEKGKNTKIQPKDGWKWDPKWQV